jgi:hypothetical protein
VQQDPVTVPRVIAVAMIMGAVVFWVVAWVATGGGAEGLADDPDVSLNIFRGAWAVAALGGLVAALVLRNHGIEAAGGESAQAPPSQFIIAWTMLEAPALMSGVFFLVFGDVFLLWSGALVFFLGMAITFPREEWFVREG